MIHTWQPVPTDNQTDESATVLKLGEYGFYNGTLYEGDGHTAIGSLPPMNFPARITNNSDGTATA